MELEFWLRGDFGNVAINASGNQWNGGILPPNIISVST
jgi:hypothetical protein